MKRLILAASLAFALSSVAAATINSAYRVTGDPAAAPVQVFDDGRELFVQLRDPAVVPAPFVNGQPAPYRIRGPYIVLPLHASLELRLGSAVVQVQRAGMPAGQKAQVFASVDPLAQAQPTALPVATSETGLSIAATPAAAPRTVSGEIALEGQAAKPATPTAPAAAGMAPNASRKAIVHALPAARSMFEGFRGQRVLVAADGTVAGARHAERLRAVCTVAGPSSCSIRYRGAAAGTSTLEIL